MPFFLVRVKNKQYFALKMFICIDTLFNATKKAGKEEETKMFRLFFALSFIFILGSCAASQNKSIKVASLICMCCVTQFNTSQLGRYAVSSLRVPIYSVSRNRNRGFSGFSCYFSFFQGSNGTQQNQCGKSVSKECCYNRDGENLLYFIGFILFLEFFISFIFLMSLLTYVLPFFSGRDGRDGKSGITNKYSKY